jgi:hypothetical protein
MPRARRTTRRAAPAQRTVWHNLFAALLLERRSPDFDVVADVPLSFEPQRADLLLVRKRRAGGRLAPGAVLRDLWPKLRAYTLVEFKSAARPLRTGDLIRLLGYGAQYHARHAARLKRGDLGLVLVVAQHTPTLDADLGRLGWRLGAGEGGYVPIEGGPYPAWVVVLDQVRQGEGEGVLGPFAGASLEPESEAWGWWHHRLFDPSGDVTMAELAKLEGYEELVAQLLARVPRAKLPGVVAKLPAKSFAAGVTAEQVAALPAEKRVAGLTVRERLSGLNPAELEALRAELAGTPPAKAKPKRRAKRTR